MTGKRLSCLVLLLVLAAAPAVLRATEPEVVEGATKIIRLAQDGIGEDVDVDAWLTSGEFRLSGGLECFPPRFEPGPAPAPYPTVHVWEPGIEQLGKSMTACDGILFLSGKNWVPKMKIFMIWKIRIPNPAQRAPEEFDRDIDLAYFVDWNMSGEWEKSEQVLQSSLNLSNLFPNDFPCLEIWYLTWFRVPEVSTFTAHCGGVEFFKEKFWTRGVLSYCDPDASANGESVFGEVEDYQVSYFEVIHKKGKKDH